MFMQTAACHSCHVILNVSFNAAFTSNYKSDLVTTNTSCFRKMCTGIGRCISSLKNKTLKKFQVFMNHSVYYNDITSIVRSVIFTILNNSRTITHVSLFVKFLVSTFSYNDFRRFQSGADIESPSIYMSSKETQANMLALSFV